MFGYDVSEDTRGVLILTALTVTPAVPVLVLLENSGWSGELRSSSERIAYALVLGAAVFIYLHWRMTRSSPGRDRATRLAGWLTAGLAITGIYGLAESSVFDAASTKQRDSWPQVGEIVLLVVLIVLAHLAERVELPGDPALIGATAGLALASIACCMVAWAPPFAVTPTTQALLTTTAMLAGLLFALTLLQRTQVSMWVRRRLAISAILLTSARCLSYLGVHSHGVNAITVIANLAGAVMLCTLAEALLRGSVLGHQHEMQRLQATLAEVRATVLEDRELLHEVGSTVAGISSASQLMRQSSRLAPRRRARLEHMLDAELARLDRLMNARAPAVIRDFDLDEVVEPLVISHQERGLDVRWTPGQVRALGDPDAVSEVVNILLENARRHGGHTVWLDVSAADHYVELACCDDGPGVAEDLHHDLFASGARGPDSPGQGLGLSIARRLMSELGGSLELAEPRTSGATFVARLQMREMAHGAAHHVA